MLQLAENKRIAVKSLNDEQKLFYLYQNLLFKDSNSVRKYSIIEEVITLHNVCDVQYTGGYREYSGGYHEYTGGVQYTGGKYEYTGRYHNKCGG